MDRQKIEIDEYMEPVRLKNIEELIDPLGLVKTKGGYKFNFFDRTIGFDGKNFVDLSGESLSLSVKKILCRYFLHSPQMVVKKSIALVTFRELAGAGPLFSRFSENTAKTIEQTFSDRLPALEERSRQLFGMVVDDASYDLSVRFKALPKVPVIFQFNDREDSLPASSTLMFHASSENYLDLKSLAAIGTYLTGSLIRQGSKSS